MTHEVREDPQQMQQISRHPWHSLAAHSLGIAALCNS